jgi:hypothetical protein
MIGRHRTLAAGFVLGALALSQTVITPPAFAQTTAGTYGAAFLGVPIGARAMSTPDVVAGLRPDASLVFGNLASSARVDHTQVFFSTATWLEDMNLSAGSAVIPLRSAGLTWSLGSRVLYSGGLQGFDASGNVVDESAFYDLALSTGLSKRFDSVGLAIGAGVTYVREHQPLQTGNAVLFSVGASYEYLGNRFEVHATDFGADLSFDGQTYPIDSRVIFGYGRAINRSWGSLDLGAQLEILKSEQKRFQVGGAYHINRFLTVRSGVQHSFNAPSSSEMPITAGLGFHYNAFSIDYAYTAQDYFPATHTFSFNYGFGAGAHSSADASAHTSRAATPRRNEPVAAVPSPVGSSGQGKNAAGVSYLVVAGTHGRLESARAEVRALRLLNVPAVTEKVGNSYRVLIGRYDSLSAANKAANEFLKKGHRFEVVQEQS